MRSALTTHLEAIASLAGVVRGRSGEHTGFPFARYFLSGIGNSLLSNFPDQKRVFQFTIEVVQEITNEDKASAEAHLEDAIEDVLDKLGTQWLLGNSVHNSEVTTGQMVEIDLHSGPAVMLPILFECTVLVQG